MFLTNFNLMSENAVLRHSNMLLQEQLREKMKRAVRLEKDRHFYQVAIKEIKKELKAVKRELRDRTKSN